jgi:hypothetical protein
MMINATSKIEKKKTETGRLRFDFVEKSSRKKKKKINGVLLLKWPLQEAICICIWNKKEERMYFVVSSSSLFPFFVFLFFHFVAERDKKECLSKEESVMRFFRMLEVILFRV